LQKVIDRGGCDNLITMLVNFMATSWGLFEGDLPLKMICIGSNGTLIDF
jgi:hypothetical protein